MVAIDVSALKLTATSKNTIILCLTISPAVHNANNVNSIVVNRVHNSNTQFAV